MTDAEGPPEAPSPLVSAVILGYNAEQFIEQAVRSVLAQTISAVEVIVVNNGSTDGTGRLVDSLEDARVRLIDVKEPLGVTTARNLGAREGKGEFVAFLDHDDSWYPEKLERQIALLRSDASVVAVGCLLRGETLTGKAVWTYGMPLTEPWQQEAIARAELIPFEPSSLLLPTATLRALDYFDERIPIVSVLELLARATKLGKIACVPEFLGTYRVHSGSLSRRRPRQVFEEMYFVRTRLAARARGEDLTWSQYKRDHPIGLLVWRKVYLRAWSLVTRIALEEHRWVHALRYGLLSAILGPLHVGKALIQRLVGKEPEG
ncbi:MAG: glycosyltransferase family 2 protein [Actinomycetota bacterium]